MYKLFCIPYAGGSSSVFYKWKNYVDKRIDLYPVELAGRGTRINEPLPASLHDIVDDIYHSIKHHIEEGSYGIFGHSMGSLVAYELCKRIRKEKNRQCSHAFFSACSAPHVERDRNIHKLDDAEFIDYIINVGGISEGFLENKELCDLFFPIIRADFKIVGLYEFVEEDSLSGTDVTVFYSKKDILDEKDIFEWQSCVANTVKFVEIDGGHFFINNNANSVVSVINNTIIKK